MQMVSYVIDHNNNRKKKKQKYKYKCVFLKCNRKNEMKMD